MPLYRRKIVLVPLAIIAAFFLWRHYLFAPMSYRLDPRLSDVVETMHDIMLQSAEERIVISNGQVEPVSLQGIIPEAIISSLEEANVDFEKATFLRWCRERCFYRASFRIYRPLTPYNPFWYFTYSSGGGIEEEVVPSLSDAVRERNNTRPEMGYFFCEPLEQEHWFLCTGQHAY
ncbi:hypothetical protein ACFQH5_12820 [Halomonas salifodinae]|uniref:Uncharacterized protein n=1 Tax=Halomonas salifodinae TaxID=438745 RepID=A0ABW2F0L5_9GAMM